MPREAYPREAVKDEKAPELLSGEPPKAEAIGKPEKPDDGYRTVLHGWGRVASNDKHYIDRIFFEGGVARNVPSEEAEEMAKSKKIKVYVLPSDAIEGDFVRVTGIQPMPVRKFASMLSAYDPAALRAALGDERVKELIQALSAK